MSKTGGQHRMVSQDAEFALRLVLFALIGGTRGSNRWSAHLQWQVTPLHRIYKDFLCQYWRLHTEIVSGCFAL